MIKRYTSIAGHIRYYDESTAYKRRQLTILLALKHNLRKLVCNKPGHSHQEEKSLSMSGQCQYHQTVT